MIILGWDVDSACVCEVVTIESQILRALLGYKFVASPVGSSCYDHACIVMSYIALQDSWMCLGPCLQVQEIGVCSVYSTENDCQLHPWWWPPDGRDWNCVCSFMFDVFHGTNWRHGSSWFYILSLTSRDRLDYIYHIVVQFVTRPIRCGTCTIHVYLGGLDHVSAQASASWRSPGAPPGAWRGLGSVMTEVSHEPKQ